MICRVIKGCNVAQCSSAKLDMAVCRCKPQWGYMNQPATSYTTKFVHVSSNKVRSLLCLHCNVGAWQQPLHIRNCVV